MGETAAAVEAATTNAEGPNMACRPEGIDGGLPANAILLAAIGKEIVGLLTGGTHGQRPGKQASHGKSNLAWRSVSMAWNICRVHGSMRKVSHTMFEINACDATAMVEHLRFT